MVVSRELAVGFFGFKLENDNHERSHEKECISEFVIFAGTVVENLVLSVVFILYMQFSA